MAEQGTVRAMRNQGKVRRDFPVDFSALKRCSAQPPQKPIFTEREENGTDLIRLPFPHIAHTGFSGPLTTWEVGDFLVTRC